MPIRTLLVDDNSAFLVSATSFLSTSSQFDVVGYARSGQEAVEQVARLQPDLVLIDVAMPNMNGLEATRHIKGRQDAPCVVVLTLHDAPQYRAAAAAVQADGFVAKEQFSEQLLPLIQTLFV